MSATTLPLLAGADPSAVLAWRDGQPLRVARYLADVAACAASLPPAGPAINLCQDRYAFAVALGATLQRGQLSLLPPNARDDTLAQLRQRDAQAYGLSDDATLVMPGLPLQPVPLLPRGGAPGASPGALPGSVPQVAAETLATSLLTSGSTGAPQPHAKTWRQWTVNIAAAAQRLAEHLDRPSLAGLTLVATVPPQHSYGFESSVLLAMLGGAAFEAGRPFYPADIAAALAAVPRPRALVTTPFHLKALLASGLDLPATDLVLSATAPLSPQLARLAERRLGGPLVEIYGSTESGQVASRRTAATDLWTTFGALRIDVASVAGADAGEPTEVFSASGGHLPEATPLSDILKLDDARHFRLLGRANDLIHVAGRRSSLGHLNHHLNSIDGVDDGAFWLPDEVADGVVRPVAFVVTATLSPAQVIAALRLRLEAVFVPRRVVPVAALPREATGKLTTQALRQFALQTLGLARPVDGAP